MKRLLGFVFILISILASTRVSAVQLEQGWYARFGFVGLTGEEPITHLVWGSAWKPTSVLGNYSYINVANAFPSFLSGRTFTISNSVVLSPSVLIEDEGLIVDPAPEFHYLHFSWETMYDSSRLQFRVVRRSPNWQDEIIWLQNSLGYQTGPGDASFLFNPLTANEKIVFQLVAVPESSSLSIFATGILGLVHYRRRLIV